MRLLLSPLGQKLKKNLRLNVLKGIIFAQSALILIVCIAPPVHLLDNRPSNAISLVNKYASSKNIKGSRLTFDQNTWVPYENVSRYLVYAIITREDGRFFRHIGFDFFEIWKSLFINLSQMRYARGGSTITQQLVKNVFLSNDKKLKRKIRELCGAVLLETLLDKKKIFEYYVNIVDFGVGRRGVYWAAKKIFDSQPEILNVDQSVWLSILLVNPVPRATRLVEKQTNNEDRYHYIDTLKKMQLIGFITQKQFEESLLIGDFGNPLEVNSDR